MIRRPPSRIELKLEDLNDFEYIQKCEKKKNPGGGVLTSADTQKLVRQERIGLSFRPIRSSSNIGSNNQASFASAVAQTSGIGGGGASSVSDIAVPATPTNNETIVDSSSGLELSNNNISAEDGSGRLNILVGDELGGGGGGASVNNDTNSSNMSLDESL